MRKLQSAFRTLRWQGFSALLVVVWRLFVLTLRRQILRVNHVCTPIYNYKLYLDVNDPGISRTLLLFRERELDHKWMLEQIVRPGDVVIDIGANIGYYAIMEAQLVGRLGKIYAFEPSPRNIDLLEKNIVANGLDDRIVVTEAAVTNSRGYKEFYISEMSNLNTFHKRNDSSEKHRYKKISVPTLAAHELLRARSDANLIRMDVEGHEVEILQDALPSLIEMDTPPKIIFELHVDTYLGRNFGDVMTDYWENGFRFEYVSSSSSRGTAYFNKHGYKPIIELKTDENLRAIYDHVSLAHILEVIEGHGGARTVVLSSKNSGKVASGL